MTQVYAPFASRLLRIARNCGLGEGRPRIELTSEQKRQARHMAHGHCTLVQIATGIGWTGAPKTLRYKLKACNITPYPRGRKV